MSEKKNQEAITPEERAKIMQEIASRPGGVSVKDIMTKYGRTEQTYYFWKRQTKAGATSAAPRAAAKRAKAAAPRKAVNSESSFTGILMPEGRAVRIHKTDTEWAIVTFE